MNIGKRLDQLEQIIDRAHRADVLVIFLNGEAARMPLETVISLLRRENGISRVIDTGNGNGVLCDLINNLLEG